MSYLFPAKKLVAIPYFRQTLPGNKNALKRLVITACIVAIIDGVVAVMITFALYGRPPVSVFQYIASGLLGSSAFSGGLSTAFIGLIYHFFNRVRMDGFLFHFI